MNQTLMRLSDADEVELVAFGVGEGDPACLASEAFGPELGEPCRVVASKLMPKTVVLVMIVTRPW
jgi:hypothetical protein